MGLLEDMGFAVRGCRSGETLNGRSDNRENSLKYQDQFPLTRPPFSGKIPRVSGIHVLIRAPWETDPAVILASGDHFWHFAPERTGGHGEAGQLASPEPGSDRLPLVPAILRDDVRDGFIILEPPVLHAVIPKLGGRRRYERFATYFERMPFTAFACWHREVACRVGEMMETGEVLAVWPAGYVRLLLEWGELRKVLGPQHETDRDRKERTRAAKARKQKKKAAGRAAKAARAAELFGA